MQHPVVFARYCRFFSLWRAFYRWAVFICRKPQQTKHALILAHYPWHRTVCSRFSPWHVAGSLQPHHYSPPALRPLTLLYWASASVRSTADCSSSNKRAYQQDRTYLSGLYISSVVFPLLYIVIIRKRLSFLATGFSHCRHTFYHMGDNNAKIGLISYHHLNMAFMFDTIA